MDCAFAMNTDMIYRGIRYLGIGLIFVSLAWALYKGAGPETHPGGPAFSRAVGLYTDEKYEEAIETIEANFHIIKNSTKGLPNSISSFEMQKKIFDNYVKEYFEKFSFIPRDGIAYKMFFTIIVLAENPNNNIDIGDILEGNNLTNTCD